VTLDGFDLEDAVDGAVDELADRVDVDHREHAHELVVVDTDLFPCANRAVRELRLPHVGAVSEPQLVPEPHSGTDRSGSPAVESAEGYNPSAIPPRGEL
jgi:hypothetical protein